MLETHQLTLKHSMNCFFNSFLRDTIPPYNSLEGCFDIPLSTGELKLYPDYFSAVGVHRFNKELKLITPGGSRWIGFLEAADLICYDRAQGDSQIFKRLGNSLHNMDLSLKKIHPKVQALYRGEINFLNAEQGLLVGHNFHPTPKSRDEFNDDDLIRYAPEFGGSFRLHWLLVKSSHLFEERSHSLGQQNYIKALYKKELPSGFLPLPVHPWQHKVLVKDPIIKDYLAQKLIIEGGESSELWHPTSSLRSLYSPHSPYMLKFSMSVRLTNSLRHLQSAEVGRGMVVQDAFNTPAGKEFTQRFPRFKIMHEPAYLGIKGPQGEILPQTIALLRENPFLSHPSDQVAVLATLTQDHPQGGKNLIATCLEQGITAQDWFMAFLDVSIMPLIMAQAEYGILLGAHQQNLLIDLKHGLPVGSYFRDCQGTGFSLLGQERLLPDMPDQQKFLTHLLPSQAAVDLFTYYLIINSTLNTIAALSLASGVNEKEFILLLQARLRPLMAKVKDPSVIKHILRSPTLNQKGNFRCSLSGINENTTQDPLSIYNKFPNPLFLETSL